MSRRLRRIEALGDLAGSRVLVRCDLNVPLERGRPADDSRVAAAVPTLRRLTGAGAAVVVCSHLGRPGGKVVEELRLGPVGERLAAALGGRVATVPTVADAAAHRAAGRLGPGEILLLENLRFEPGEAANDPSFAASLASMADAYVDDAFGAAHRAHASIVGVARRLPSAAGELMAAEVEALARIRDDPAKPFVAILGGAKVGDKLPMLKTLVEKVDALLVGGAMAFTFLAAEGTEVGRSLVDRGMIDDVRRITSKARRCGTLIQLPEDVVVADAATAGAGRRTVPVDEIPRGQIGLDVGPRTVEEFARTVADARTIFWNGPMGMFELEPFAAGTLGVARAVAGSGAFSVVGGGDSVAALRKLDLADSVGHLSTGGGASLEFIQGLELPGLAVLMEDGE